MALNSTFPDFHVLEDTRKDDRSLPAFMVTTTRGFLPRDEPLVELPVEFAPLNSILHRLPIKTLSGSPGLLASGTLGSEVDTAFPNLQCHVAKYQDDQVVLTALYRDYSFLASAYLLEPCHGRMVKTGEYGVGREALPECISLPLVEVARLTGFKPFMEYAGSYALYNYRLLDPNLGLAYGNLALIRAFEHGLGGDSSEAGFVLTHVDMVKESPGLVAGAVKALKGAGLAATGGDGDRGMLRDGLREVGQSLRRVNKVMERMWARSKPGEYGNFRTFIFGITGQSMFPNGVLYKGVSETPYSFRGESGANDSMIPLCDNLLQIPMPPTPLTSILHEFRQYRPGNHHAFLCWVDSSARQSSLKSLSLSDIVTAGLYLLALDQVRDFRWRHWCFAREYIIKKAKHPTATGGSPIVRWLPNQLHAVLGLELEVVERMKELGGGTIKGWVEEVRGKVDRQKRELEKEVEKFCGERGENL